VLREFDARAGAYANVPELSDADNELHQLELLAERCEMLHPLELALCARQVPIGT
jgi:hypothetical protein